MFSSFPPTQLSSQFGPQEIFLRFGFQATLTPEVVDNIFCLAKVDSGKKVAHLNFHVFNYPTNIANVTLRSR